MASRGINKVILVGNLGQDPETKFFPNGGAVTNVSLATSESWKDKQTGEQKEKTEWHRIAIFGKLAEIAAEHLKKGSKVYFEGKLQTRKWQDQQGQDRYTTEVIIDGFDGAMQMLDSREQNGQQGGYSQQASSQQSAPQQQGGFNQQQAAPQQQGGFNNQTQRLPTMAENEAAQQQSGFNNQQQATAQQQGGFNQAAAPAQQPAQSGGFNQSGQQSGGFNQAPAQQNATNTNQQQDPTDDIPF